VEKSYALHKCSVTMTKVYHPMTPLQRRKERQWVDPDESDEDDDESDEDTQEQDIALVVNNSSNGQMLDYLCLIVAIEKGIREPNIDSWASSLIHKLSRIDMKMPRAVVSNIIQQRSRD
jgi:hypothetical protein